MIKFRLIGRVIYMIVSFLKIKEEKIDAAKGIIVNKYAAEILDIIAKEEN